MQDNNPYRPLPSSVDGGREYPPAPIIPRPPSSGAQSVFPPPSASSLAVSHLLPLTATPLSLLHNHSKARRWSVRLVIKYTLVTVVVVILSHFFILGAFPGSTYSTANRDRLSSWLHTSSYIDEEYTDAVDEALKTLTPLDPAITQPGIFFRDTHPIRTALAFWQLAEKEISEHGLDTCNDQLGRSLVEAYHSSQLEYCVPKGVTTPFRLTASVDVPINASGLLPDHWRPGDLVPPTHVACTPVHRNPSSKWWPYPAAPCFSTNLRADADERSKYHAVGCDLTPDGMALNEEMGRERFVGVDTTIDGDDDHGEACRERVEHTLVIIGRQDQWNPFHVAEDLITTLVTIFIAARTEPAFIDTRVQLVFKDEFSLEGNHFTPLWDRMGAWAPRRLALDPWTEGVCLTNTIHSVGAGASLLSAMGVGQSNTCTSSITWAASHYYRHLMGLQPPSITQSRPGGGTGSINVLWLSRSKLDAYATKHNDLGPWRANRVLTNEPQLLDRFRSGLQDMCLGSGPGSHSLFANRGCIFQDAQDKPESWGSSANEDGPVNVRFATIDPTVHSLEDQIHFVGHTTIMISSHGGAMGLSLFLPPGLGAMIELQVIEVRGNYHFEHMAAQTGHGYERVEIDRRVDVEHVWDRLRYWVELVVKDLGLE
ncbi:hypothetical protein M231_07046 [Tremella mesenterica]|uniref:Uncharacterized protein n=1 Tax=Tremella mesenterica TaxID=5217 RepID=A0A4Q1BG08_TREME|nr:hypothetical protein M231_07046 [Tremella mesenterica]